MWSRDSCITHLCFWSGTLLCLQPVYLRPHFCQIYYNTDINPTAVRSIPVLLLFLDRVFPSIRTKMFVATLEGQSQDDIANMFTEHKESTCYNSAWYCALPAGLPASCVDSNLLEDLNTSDAFRPIICGSTDGALTQALEEGYLSDICDVSPASNTSSSNFPNKEQRDTPRNNRSDVPRTYCPEPGCRRFFYNSERLWHHYRSHKQLQRCPEPSCGNHFVGDRQLTLHTVAVHSWSPWTCELPSLVHAGQRCDELCISPTELEGHLASHGGNTRLPEERFSREDPRIRSRGMLRPHGCDRMRGLKKCRSTFAEGWRLEAHIRKEHRG